MWIYGRGIQWTRPNDDRLYEAEGMERIDLPTLRGLPPQAIANAVFDVGATPKTFHGIPVILGLTGFAVTLDSGNNLLLGHSAASAGSRWRGTLVTRFA